MAIIGNPIVSTDFPKDTFSGNGSTTAFTMQIAPASVNSVIVVVSGITQDPSTYTISGTTLTFSAAPPTGTSNISVRHLGIAGIPNTPSAGSVVSASIADANITQAKLASGVAGTGPAFSAYSSNNQVVSTGATTKVILNSEAFDTASCFDSTTNYRFTPNVAGYYQFNGILESYAQGNSIVGFFATIFKNGTEVLRGSGWGIGGTITEGFSTVSGILYMNGTTDYVEMYGYVAASGSPTFYGNQLYRTFSGHLVRAA